MKPAESIDEPALVAWIVLVVLAVTLALAPIWTRGDRVPAYPLHSRRV